VKYIYLRSIKRKTHSTNPKGASNLTINLHCLQGCIMCCFLLLASCANITFTLQQFFQNSICETLIKRFESVENISMTFTRKNSHRTTCDSLRKCTAMQSHRHTGLDIRGCEQGGRLVPLIFQRCHGSF